MDIDATLRELVREWKCIKRAMARLEAQQSKSESQPKKRRGRKSMGPEERLEVARRMKEYWQSRRERESRKPPPGTSSEQRRTNNAPAAGRAYSNNDR